MTYPHPPQGGQPNNPGGPGPTPGSGGYPSAGGGPFPGGPGGPGAPMGQSPIGPMPSGPTPGSGGRQWLVPSIVGVVVVAVVVALAVVLGGSSTPGRAAAGTDERTVAQTFANLEDIRWNAGSPDNPPNASSAAYASVSCKADLAEMRKDDVKPAQPKPGPQLYTFAIKSIAPSTRGRQLLTITRTTLASKETGDGLFYLQQESGKWKVCGLFADTEPPDPDASPSSGSEPPPSDSAPPSAPGGGGGSEQEQVRSFANSFAEAVGTGVFPLVHNAICADDQAADGPIQQWTNAKAQVTVQSITAGATGGSAKLQVSGPGLPSSTPTIVIGPENGTLCIQVLAP